LACVVTLTPRLKTGAVATTSHTSMGSACNGHVLRAPADGTGSAQDLQPVDFVLISVVFLGLLVGTYVLLWRVCSAVSS
jgi:hypothetical protein